MLLTSSLVALVGLSGSNDAVPTSATPTTPAPVTQDADKVPEWTGSVTAGSTKTSGNTDTISAVVGVDAVRASEHDRYTLRGSWNYAEQNGTISERNVGASLKYDYFVTEKLYYLAISGAKSDTVANLDLRYYAGAGAGYQFRDDEKLQLGGEAALTYFSEEYGDSTDNSYLAARLGSTLGYQYSETTRFEQILEAFPSLEDSDDFTAKADHRVRVDVTENFFAQLQWIYDYDNTPAAGFERLDQKVALGIGWGF